ncbi:MAG: hypothetical protein GOVbin2066_24 [Prokaryotic dsDNA virus sp.]|nr:MAG: hypothetical protein GOVbin2066_24 [Prokaryotic dsDNA virus sp.]|tara:strand:+ start:157 stop:414 length:258 start_codon:yes stop_codon:yes gene_type:complete
MENEEIKEVITIKGTINLDVLTHFIVNNLESDYCIYTTPPMLSIDSDHETCDISIDTRKPGILELEDYIGSIITNNLKEILEKEE